MALTDAPHAPDASRVPVTDRRVGPLGVDHGRQPLVRNRGIRSLGLLVSLVGSSWSG
jgi:hypothetical protein